MADAELKNSIRPNGAPEGFYDAEAAENASRSRGGESGRCGIIFGGNNMIRFHEACGKTGKTVAARLLPDTDLIEGIEAVCEKNKIRYAYVTCFGSFKNTGYMYLVPKADAKVGAGYGDVLRCDGPIEFLNGTGVVCQNDGKYDTHFHATMCDASGKVFGGHIVKGTTPALTTVDLMIFEVEDIQMLRVSDEETALTQFFPTRQQD